MKICKKVEKKTVLLPRWNGLIYKECQQDDVIHVEIVDASGSGCHGHGRGTEGQDHGEDGGQAREAEIAQS